MEFLSKTKFSLLEYIWNRKVIALLSLYFTGSISVFLLFDIDLLIPCVFKTFFHFECYGCGLTSAFIKLLKLDIVGAYQTNAILFVVLPIGFYSIRKDYVRFFKNRKSNNTII